MNIEVLNAYDKMANASGKSIGCDAKRDLITDAVFSAWDKNEDPAIRHMRSTLGGHNIRNFGEKAQIEVLGKLGIWLSQANIDKVERRNFE